MLKNNEIAIYLCSRNKMWSEGVLFFIMAIAGNFEILII